MKSLRQNKRGVDKPITKKLPLNSHRRVRSSRTYEFNSASTTPITSALRRRGDKVAVPPKVFYTWDAWNTIQHVIATCKKEVGWLGLVETRDDGYLITEVFIPEQEVTATETNIDPKTMAALVIDLLDGGKDPSKLIYWGHSHVNMNVGPSGQDEDQINEFITHCPVFIRGIYNRRGDSKVDVYLTKEKVIHQCVENGPLTEQLTVAQLKALDKIIKKNVIEAAHQPYLNTWVPGYNGRTPTNNQLDFGAGDFLDVEFDDFNESDEFNDMATYEDPLCGRDPHADFQDPETGELLLYLGNHTWKNSRGDLFGPPTE